MIAEIDRSVYPDEDPPKSFDAIADRADYIQRICAAWDVGLTPGRSTFNLFAGWRRAFDAYPLLHSPAYRAFRATFGWPEIAGSMVADSYAERLDARDGRPASWAGRT